MQVVTICLLMMALLIATSCDAREAAGQPVSSTDVTAYGARADGKTDDTAAFQRALDAAGKKGGVVSVPPGGYLIAGSLSIPEGVTLQGIWQAPHNTALGKGSVIYATGSAGKEDGPPLINLDQNSCIKGMTIFYPDQDATAIKPYPWTIQGKGTNCSVIDVTLANPYKAIDMGTHWNELHYIRNVYGQPLKIGVYIDKCTDIGRVENVHFNPNAWTRSGHPSAPTGPKTEALYNYLKENLVGFKIARTDWEYISNCFVIFPKIGFHFTSGEMGPGNALISQSGGDICETAVQVDATQGHAGAAFTGCQFMSRVVVSPTNDGPIKFANCGFWPIDKTASQAVIEGRGTVTFTGTHFADWGNSDPNAACINVKSGSVIVNGCEFDAAGKRQIELGAGTKSATILGCQFKGGEKITNNAPATAKIQIGLNIE